MNAPAISIHEESRLITEIELLGALLHYGDPASFHVAAAIVGPEHFSDALHARIFSIMANGYAENLSKFPLIAYLISELRGDATLSDLNLTASAIIGKFIAHAAPQIAIEGGARQIRHDWLNDRLKAAVEGGETDKAELFAAEMERLSRAHLTKDDGVQSIGKSAPKILDRIADLYQNGTLPDTGAYPGSRDLESLLGGWRAGKFYVIGGRPGMGKSSTALSWVLRTAEKGHGVLFFSLEMTLNELTEIAMCDLAWQPNARIEYRDIAAASAKSQGLEWKYDALRWASERFEAMPLTFIDRTGLTLGDIRSQALQQAQRFEAQGEKLEVIVVDHLGLIKADSRYSGNKVAETEELSAALKALSKELGIAVICLVQLNRGVEGREDKQPSLSDLRWSGAIEQDADVVMFVYREAYYLQKQKDDPQEDEQREAKLLQVKNELKLIVAKHRGGPTPTMKFFCDIGCGVIRDSAK